MALTGTMVGREASPPRVLVAHDAIAGVMPAMTMPFEIRGATPFMREGDRIEATLVMTSTASWLEDVRVTTAGGVPGARETTASRAVPGALVPAFALVNQDGGSFTLSDFRSRVLVLTFIYVRCPLPDACPLMISHLEAVRRGANEAGIGGRVRFLAVTLDPAFDRPEVLRAYGDARLRGDDRFDQWTMATGTAQQVEEVAAFIGVGYRAEDGFVTHTMATAVVGTDGRVVRVFPSNSWTPADVLDIVRREASADAR